jgi:protein SCO1/2
MLNTKNIRTIIGIAVAIGLPLSFYLIAKGLSKAKIMMPRYFVAEEIQKGAGGLPDTSWHRAAEFRGVNQLGEQVALNAGLEDRLLAVNFFFASCPTVCPQLTTNMGLLQRAFTKSAKDTHDTIRVQIVSITVDPIRDSPSVLRAYADRYRANHDRWWFINAPRAEVARYMRDDLGLAGGTGEGGMEDLAHSQSIVILDKERYIRGVYNGLDSAEVRRCAEDLVLLSMEKKRPRKVH